jgi:hypothetical protein
LGGGGADPLRPHGRTQAFKTCSRAGGAPSIAPVDQQRSAPLLADSGGPAPPTLARPPGFEPVAAPRQLHYPRRMVQELNLVRTLAPASGFQPGTLPLGQPSLRGRCWDRTSARLSPRPRFSKPAPFRSANLPSRLRADSHRRKNRLCRPVPSFSVTEP